MKRNPAGLLFMGFSALFLSGCYYTTQGYYLLSYQAKAKSAEKLLKQEDLPQETREFLLLVQDIRNYAVTELGLKTNKNYTEYLDLDQDVLAWVVSACDPLAFNTYLWKYPFMGELPYKGFYRIDDARKEGQARKDEGKDVWVRGVEAFSTLGYFKDPLISYMAKYSVYDLANLIIHEQTHATIWRKDDTSFNEDLASFVGDEGARLFVLSRFGPESPEYLRIDENKENSRLFREDVLRLKDELDLYYRGIPSPPLEDERIYIEEKQRIIREFQLSFLTDYELRYTADTYRGFGELPVNNAYLDLFQLYHGQREWFEEQYALSEYDMKAFLTVMQNAPYPESGENS
ncbi:aminopeptidase [Breznakiella homolactica]|uniref:Aminopeptidase n=1 Tax=Breznakiella homolactica TaxID=2798577 RepID=A0A7T8BAH1_9SPIR|nr:aminopeptidase [Breznakiella homolactica]QQO09366.1 aminopeptidase [Breznakiella homolactica]